MIKLKAFCRTTLAATAIVTVSSFAAIPAYALPSETVQSTQKQIRDLVPAAIRERGVLRYAADPGSAPFILKDTKGSGWSGATYELMEGVAKELGLKLEYLSTAFGNLVTVLQAGRADVSAGELTDTPERRKVVLFVDYEKVWHQLLVQPGNPSGIHSLEDACGKTAGAPIGGLDGTIMQTQAKQCTKEGKPALTIKSFQGIAATTTALASRRVDVIAEEYAVGKYAAETEHVVEQIPGRIKLFQGMHGVAVSKDQHDLALAIALAIDKMINSGEYAAIYKKYELSDTMIPLALLNGQPVHLK
jgi:polar amino acid transport system substrate-binding protein